MLNSEDISRQITSEDEALVVLASLGFTMDHWPFIKKGGEARAILQAKLVDRLLNKAALSCETYFDQMRHLRKGLDAFYETGGFLISPLTHPCARLFKAGEAPLVFFGRHNRELLSRTPAVAIVGSRYADPDALMHTEHLAKSLAKRGINVISGGAAGVDTAAHLGAHEGEGPTILISGLRCDFRRSALPAELARIPCERLLVLHPYGPFFPQKNYMFVTRNQFVAALGDRLVVVQGLIKSGTLHTVEYARMLNIPIFAIPGAISNPKSHVPNHLLEEGVAQALVDFDQFASSLTPSVKPIKSTKPAVRQPPFELSPLLALIRDHEGALTLDELVALSGKPLGDCQFELLEHELAGQIIRRGAQFVLCRQ